jgi:tetratricopeptide (TPR) repeat protein
MKKRKIWAGLSSAVLVAAPAAAQATVLHVQPQAGIESKADQTLLHLAQHQGHAAPAATAGGEGEGEGGGAAQLQPSIHVYRGIEMIRGHLLVGAELIEAGRWADALPHFLHPEEEIYGSIRDQLKTFNIAPFQVALKSLSQTVKAKNKEAYARARAALDERLAAAETAVKAKEANGTYFVLETALEVLQQAADEYEEAIQKGRIANVVEYQDARGFVFEVDRLVGTVMPAASAKNADAAKALQASLNDLKATFPAVTPPKQAVKDSGEFLSAIAKFELQLGNFH